MNDTIDAFGLIRDIVILPGIIDTRFSALWGWVNIDRNNNLKDDNAMLFGLFTESDFRLFTLAVDLAYVLPDGDVRDGSNGLFLGLSSVQRLVKLDTAFM